MPGSTRSPSPALPSSSDAVVIRPAYPDDAAALQRLAALDSRRPLSGPILLAARDGRPLAALARRDGRTVADPFAPTADLVALLRLHAAPTAARSGRRRELLRRVAANPRRRPALARG
ncbi:MAG TPA: hypothetical protein VK501_05760 [Baekduia sp.]|uniref:hypothetical protein n=1 Tax=Baekduia sp. TaxID=2600305 RepID=UPI002B571120|nr:hypothetical protein [Baekduia sp.]HMJ33400.1 hypothetical protein [Baekduia sp.]